MPKKRKIKKEPPRWKWIDGWRAAAGSALCVEGILAGGNRPCMPSLDTDKLIGLLLSMNAVGIAELYGLFAAVPAFIVAASPMSLGIDPKNRNTVIIVLAVLTLSFQLFVSLMVWLPLLGVVIGLLIRWYPWVRQRWLLSALFAAAAFGVIQFSGLQYGHIHCGP
ncbi:MAG TPA: hypothetical protein VII69_11205 [Candidatus Eremiobacteraceae bacterium]